LLTPTRASLPSRAEAAAVVWVKVGSRRVRKQTHTAAHSKDTEGIPDR
jgi:hypothetical protein